jgi:beta-glucosidase
MPGSNGVTDAQLVKAVKEGVLPEAALDVAVERLLKIVFRAVDGRKKTVWDKEKHHALAVKIEEESAVLLKNDKKVLPLAKGKKIAFIGEFAKKPRFQGGGSSHINPFKVSNALEAVRNVAAGVTYTRGFYADRDEKDKDEFAAAVASAKQADAAVIFAGLPDSFESEGYDRTHMRLPDCQNELIKAVAKVQPNTVVVLHNGSPVEMPWADDVAAILEVYLGGQGVGEAEVNLLFGLANPSGKLAETIPYKLPDNPSYLNFPGDKTQVKYAEGIYVGYRYYDKKELPVRFPFGHGLSYTTFTYSNLSVDKKTFKAGETLTVTVDVTNTGNVAGKEVVQLYVSDKATPNRPMKELKGFAKVSLKKGQTKTVNFVLDSRAFAYYNTDIGDWYVTGGTYEILIGKSSQDIVLAKTVKITQPNTLPWKIDKCTTAGDLLADSRTQAVFSEELQKLVAESALAVAAGVTPEAAMNILRDMPLHSGRSFCGIDEDQLDDIVYKARKQVHE